MSGNFLPTFELTQADLEADIAERALAVQEDFALKGLFVWHEHKEDAVRALAHIPAGSIVLNEGYMTHPERTWPRFDQMTELAQARLALGFYDSRAQNTMSDYLDGYAVGSGEGYVYDAFGYHFAQGVFEKNAVLLPADYIRLEAIDPVVQRASGLRAQLSALPWPEDDDYDEHVRISFELTKAEAAYNVLREESAALHAVRFLSAYKESGLLGRVAITDDGRVDASVVYGLAHRNSLPAAFSALGIELPQTLVNREGYPIEAIHCLEHEKKTTDEFLMNEIANHYKAQAVLLQYDVKLDI